MRKPEAAFYQLLKKNRVLPGDISRVENTADVGMPDLSCAFFTDYWVELKAFDTPFANTDVEKILRPAQVVWHKRREREGSRIFVLVKHSDALLLYCAVAIGYHKILMVLKESNRFDYSLITNSIVYLVNPRV